MCHACPRRAMLHAPCRANARRRAMRMWTDLLGSRRSARVQKRCRSVGPSPRSARPTHSEPPRAARGARLATAPGLLEAERRPEAARALAAWGGASPGPEPVIDVGLSWWVPKLCWFGPKNGPFCFRGGLSPTPSGSPSDSESEAGSGIESVGSRSIPLGLSRPLLEVFIAKISPTMGLSGCPWRCPSCGLSGDPPFFANGSG